VVVPARGTSDTRPKGGFGLDRIPIGPRLSKTTTDGRHTRYSTTLYAQFLKMKTCPYHVRIDNTGIDQDAGNLIAIVTYPLAIMGDRHREKESGTGVSSLALPGGLVSLVS
jgi:hypothetical protein